MTEICWMGVRELASAVARRKLSPVEIVDALLRRIDQLDGRLRCYLKVFGDEAREAAHAAEAAVAAGKPIGPLHGVPVGIKDLFDLAGVVTTAGSRLLTKPAVQDSTVVTRLKSAGAIILGKLNLHEFAYGPEGTNAHFGTPWNPWDAKIHRIPGGSSSGSGVAVAAGLLPMGMGTDTGGSIRMPAACCGVVGLKPTFGRVSKAGVWPLAWTMDHMGPLTRTVEDAALVLNVIAGFDPADSTTASQPVPDYAAALSLPVRGLRIGVFTDYVAMANRVVGDALRAAAADFEKLGCMVEEISLPSHQVSVGASFAVLGAEAYAVHEPLLREHVADYAPDVRRRLLAAAFLTASDYINGQRARRLLRDEVDAVFRRVDCVLAPTTAIQAPPVDAQEVSIGERTMRVRPAITMFTRLFNLTGHPVLAMPCGFSLDGMPLSMQLVGRAFDEATILRLGKAYQDAADWHRRRPPCAVV